MKKFVAFLRAVNVGGRAIVRMTDLRDSFAAAGCENVRTYIQSGNVLFDLLDKDARTVLKTIPLKLRELLGKEPEILFRISRDLEKLAAAAPFRDIEPDPETKRYVAFLAHRPLSTPAFPLHIAKEALEIIALSNLEAYVVSRRKPNGMFGFPNESIEKELGVLATSRNWNTVTKMLKLLSVDG